MLNGVCVRGVRLYPPSNFVLIEKMRARILPLMSDFMNVARGQAMKIKR